MAKAKILVVDDEPPLRLLVQKILELDGYAVKTAASGMDALKEVRREQPDLVILDLSMPGIDGFATCSMLKRDSNFRAPVIVLSARIGERDILQAKEAGCDAFIHKPVKREELLAKVAELLAAKPTPTE